MKNDIYLHEDNKIFSDCLKKNYSEFIKLLNLLIDNLISDKDSKETLLFLNTFHRNTFSSTLINELKQLFVFSKLFKISSDSTFYTNSKNVFNLLEEKKVDVVFIDKSSSLFRKKATFILFFTLQTIFLKLFCRSNSLEKKSNSLYFEVFESCSDKSQIGSHYYPQFLLSDLQQRKDLRFIVSLLNINSIKKYFLLHKKMQESKIPLVITDFNFSIQDIRTFWKLIDMEILKLDKSYKFCDFDISTLVKEKLLLEKFSRTSFNAYLRFIDVRDNQLYNDSTLILWHENHGLDKAACLANSLRKQKINIVGHQGFPSSIEKNCDYPSKVELDKNLAPKNVYKLILSENNYYQEEKRAPAFRFHRIFGNKNKKKAENLIAIAFPLTNSDTQIKEILKINNAFLNSGYDVQAKMHPLQSKDHIKSIKDNCNLVDSIDDFYEVIRNSSLFLSSGLTNMYYESFFLGKNSINLSKNKMSSNKSLINTGFHYETSSFKEIKSIADLKQTIPEEVIREYLGFFIEPNFDNIQSFLRNIRS